MKQKKEARKAEKQKSRKRNTESRKSQKKRKAEKQTQRSREAGTAEKQESKQNLNFIKKGKAQKKLPSKEHTDGKKSVSSTNFEFNGIHKLLAQGTIMISRPKYPQWMVMFLQI